MRDLCEGGGGEKNPVLSHPTPWPLLSSVSAGELSHELR